MDSSESTPDRMNAFPPTLSNPVTMLPGAACLGEGGMEGSLLPGAARLLGLRFCSRSEAMLSLLHVRAILPERGPSAAAAVEALRARYVSALQAGLASLESELEFHVDTIALSYRPSAHTAEEYLARWLETRDRDLEQGFNRDGPHRGDLSIRAGDRMAAPRLSRGLRVRRIFCG